MSRFGWAYVDCEPMGSATGPTGSVQFLTGAGFTSGTADFMWYTSSGNDATVTPLKVILYMLMAL